MELVYKRFFTLSVEGDMRFASWLSASVLLCTGLACGDDDTQDKKKLAELTTPERAELCRDVDAMFVRMERAAVVVQCTQQGRVNPPTCELGREMCIARTPPGDSLDLIIRVPCGDGPDAVTQQCGDVTLGEMEDCFEDIAQTVEQMAEKFTCDAKDIGVATMPAACMALGARCPALSRIRLN